MRGRLLRAEIKNAPLTLELIELLGGTNSGADNGYARVSTDARHGSIDAQMRQLRKAGCETVLRDIASGAKAAGGSFAGCSANSPPTT